MNMNKHHIYKIWKLVYFIFHNFSKLIHLTLPPIQAWYLLSVVTLINTRELIIFVSTIEQSIIWSVLCNFQTSSFEPIYQTVCQVCTVREQADLPKVL